MRAIRFHYHPVRYLWTRGAANLIPRIALGPLGCISLDDIDPPSLPGPEWTLIETTLSGVCGSDLSAVLARDSFTLEPFGAYPFTFGHENVGRVAEVGAEVKGWTVGDRVVVNPMLACRQRGLVPECAPCGRGEYGLCRRTAEGSVGAGPMIGFSPGAGGGWSRYFAAHQSQLHGMGDLTDDVAVLTDAFVSSLRPVLLHPPAPDDVVLVIGAGTIGLLLVKALRLVGWRGPIATLGRYSFQLALAEGLGADHLLVPSDLRRWVASLPDARVYRPTLAPSFIEGGPSLVFDTVGSRESANDALALTREGGRIVLIGGATRIAADWTRLWFRQLQVSGVFAYGEVDHRGQRRDIYQVALELMSEADLVSTHLVSHTFPLSDYRTGLTAAIEKKRHRSTKVVFYPDA